MWGQIPHFPFLGLSVALKALSVMPRRGDLACMGKDLTPCAAVGPPFKGFKFFWDLFPGRCPGLAWAAPLGRKTAVSMKLLMAATSMWDLGSGPLFPLLGSKRRAESAIGDAPVR